jgi:hypothetical protein
MLNLQDAQGDQKVLELHDAAESGGIMDPTGQPVSRGKAKAPFLAGSL